VRLRAGEFGEAILILKRGLGVCQRHNIPVWFPPLASSLGYARALAGQLEEAATLLGQAVDQAASTGLFFFYTAALIWLADTHRLAGRLEDATRMAREALALCRDRAARANRAPPFRP